MWDSMPQQKIPNCLHCVCKLLSGFLGFFYFLFFNAASHNWEKQFVKHVWVAHSPVTPAVRYACSALHRAQQQNTPLTSSCRLKKNTFLIKITCFDTVVQLKMSVAFKLLECGSFLEHYFVLQSFSRCPSSCILPPIFGSGVEITCYAAIWLQQ